MAMRPHARPAGESWLPPAQETSAMAKPLPKGRSKLSFDGRLVEDRPDLSDSSFQEFVENILRERDSPAIHVEAKELSLRRTIEAQSARDKGRLGNQHLNIEMKIGNRVEVALQHRAITRQADP